MLENELKNLGLSEKEAKVYLATLELGNATAQEVSKKAGINRATTYFVLKQLMDLGLASETEENKKTKFVAESPERLGVLLKKKEEDLKFNESLLENILPRLRSVYGHSENKPVVRFEGSEGAKNLREEILKLKNEDLLAFTNLDLVKSVFSSKENQEFIEKKAKNKVKTRFIYTASFAAKTNPRFLEEAVRIRDKDVRICADITIYGDKIKIAKIKNKENIALVTIEDKDIADTLKSLFKLAWQGAKKSAHK